MPKTTSEEEEPASKKVLEYLRVPQFYIYRVKERERVNANLTI